MEPSTHHTVGRSLRHSSTAATVKDTTHLVCAHAWLVRAGAGWGGGGLVFVSGDHTTQQALLDGADEDCFALLDALCGPPAGGVGGVGAGRGRACVRACVVGLRACVVGACWCRPRDRGACTKKVGWGYEAGV
jgi:hypothetical protein